MKFLSYFIDQATNIKATSDIESTVLEIRNNVSMRGYNLWILVASTMLACIGLDTNSTAVIIGAMLISPLMSPILGVGLALGTHDNEMIRYSSKNLTIAIVVSMLTSIIYFLLTPLGNPTAEIIARTKPTLLDVLVALFGGIAGIVSISRKDKTNAIPGVAIATALMPPLCTAGFGIATGELKIFFGAFYLFIINAVFISLATFSIVKYLKFPIKKYIDSSVQKVYTKYAVLSLFLLLIPGALFLYDVYKENRFNAQISEIIDDYIQTEKNEVIKWDLIENDSSKVIKFFISGENILPEKVAYYNKIFIEKGLEEYKAEYIRINISKDEIQKLSYDIAQSMFKSYELQSIKQEISKVEIDTTPNYQLISSDAILLQPSIKQISIGETIATLSENLIDTITSVIVEEEYRKKSSLSEDVLYDYFKSKLAIDTLKLILIKEKSKSKQ